MNALITLLIVCLVLGVIYYIITILPLPAPFRTIALVIIGVIAIIYLISLLFGAGAFPKLNL